VLPAAALVLVMGVTGFAAAAVPSGEHRGAVRTGIAMLALLVVLRACVVPFLRWMTTTLVVTDRRVSTRQGILRSRTRDVSLWRIADVVVERTLLQRLNGSGTLLLDTTGERGGLVVRDVPGVTAVAAELNELLDDLSDLDDDPDEEGELEEEADRER
jgi:uncharacterized membrane protein YdbT with pleckstrin-like domain